MMIDKRVLIADDDLTFCRLVAGLLNREGYDTIVAGSVSECTKLLAREKVHILMQDMCFPSLNDGFEMLDFVRENYPDTTVLMISGEGNIPDAVAAIKNGAADFIEKPIAPEHLLLRIKAIVTRLNMESQIKDLSKAAIGMIGVSNVMQRVYDEIIKAANFDCPILITGETGVGKELAAKAIHRLSKAQNKELIIINCGAIPKELFESEIFGYEQGAFTGANRSHKGYFEYAQNSAVFLDEISELPYGFQVKLLRVLSEGEIQKVGGKIMKINSRVFSASNQDLPTLIQKGLFREDLYYRLNTINIHIPPLRERPEDVIPLANHFLNQVCAENGIAPLGLSPQAASWLMEQEWKGNVRELKNTIYRGVIFANTELISVANLRAHEFSTENNDSNDQIPLKQALRRYERAYIINALKTNSYNVPQTAKDLNIDKSNLFKKIKALEIELDKNQA